MTLDDFIARLPVTAQLFAALTREEHARNPSAFPLERTEIDWFAELHAYARFVEAEDLLAERGIDAKAFCRSEDEREFPSDGARKP